MSTSVSAADAADTAAVSVVSANSADHTDLASDLSALSPLDWIALPSDTVDGDTATQLRKSSHSISGASRKIRVENALEAAVEGWEATERDPVGDRSWRKFANCANIETDVFYPQSGVFAESAVSVCAECSVAKECLAAGLVGNEHGVWGGTSQRLREDVMKLARKRVRENSDDQQVTDFVEQNRRTLIERNTVLHDSIVLPLWFYQTCIKPKLSNVAVSVPHKSATNNRTTTARKQTKDSKRNISNTNNTNTTKRKNNNV